MNTISEHVVNSNKRLIEGEKVRRNVRFRRYWDWVDPRDSITYTGTLSEIRRIIREARKGL